MFWNGTQQTTEREYILFEFSKIYLFFNDISFIKILINSTILMVVTIYKWYYCFIKI